MADSAGGGRRGGAEERRLPAACLRASPPGAAAGRRQAGGGGATSPAPAAGRRAGGGGGVCVCGVCGCGAGGGALPAPRLKNLSDKWQSVSRARCSLRRKGGWKPRGLAPRNPALLPAFGFSPPPPHPLAAGQRAVRVCGARRRFAWKVREPVVGFSSTCRVYFILFFFF